MQNEEVLPLEKVNPKNYITVDKYPFLKNGILYQSCKLVFTGNNATTSYALYDPLSKKPFQFNIGDVVVISLKDININGGVQPTIGFSKTVGGTITKNITDVYNTVDTIIDNNIGPYISALIDATVTNGNIDILFGIWRRSDTIEPPPPGPEPPTPLSRITLIASGTFTPLGYSPFLDDKGNVFIFDTGDILVNQTYVADPLPFGGIIGVGPNGFGGFSNTIPLVNFTVTPATNTIYAQAGTLFEPYIGTVTLTVDYVKKN